MNHLPIHSPRLILREIQANDVDAIYSYRSLVEVAQYQYWQPFTKEQTIAFVAQCSNPKIEEKGTWIGLAIEKENVVIGDCAFCLNETSAEIGCNISPLYQKQGFAQEILHTLCNYIFANTDIVEICGITDSENISSIKLMKTVGMTKVPGFENKIICKGLDCTEYKYSIIKK